MFKKGTRKLIILLIVIFNLSTYAQVQTWIDYTTNNWINSNWLYYGDYGLRGLLTVDEWSQYTVNPAFLYRSDEKLTFHAGSRLMFTDNTSTSNTFEVRPWQGARYIWPRFERFYLDHYFRIEERFVWYTNIDEFEFSLRSRYRLRLRTMDFLLPLIPTKFTSAVSFELFMDITSEIHETYVGRNRITFGLGNHVTKDLLIELDFILQKSRKEVTSDFETVDHIFRFRIKHNLAKGLIFN
jgi:hypothetical protein